MIRASCLFFKTEDYNTYLPGLASGAKMIVSSEAGTVPGTQRPTMDAHLPFPLSQIPSNNQFLHVVLGALLQVGRGSEFCSS